MVNRQNRVETNGGAGEGEGDIKGDKKTRDYIRCKK